MLLFVVGGIIRSMLFKRKEHRSLRKPSYHEEGNKLNVLDERLYIRKAYDNKFQPP